MCQHHFMGVSCMPKIVAQGHAGAAARFSSFKTHRVFLSTSAFSSSIRFLARCLRSSRKLVMICHPHQ